MTVKLIVVQNMKIEYAVFDIDGVLCKEGKNIMKSSIEAIKRLEQKKIKILYASGKHPWYITGGLTFSGLLKNDTIIIGENGGYIFFPREKKEYKCSEKHLEDIEVIKKEFYKEYPNLIFEGEYLWEEPKSTIFTLFVKKTKIVSDLENILKKEIEKMKLDLYTLKHKHSVDIVPNILNKAYALEELEKRSFINIKKTMAFGNDLNDHEMLKLVEFPIAVGNAKKFIKDTVRSRGGIVAKKYYGDGVLDIVNMILGD